MRLDGACVHVNGNDVAKFVKMQQQPKHAAETVERMAAIHRDDFGLKRLGAPPSCTDAVLAGDVHSEPWKHGVKARVQPSGSGLEIVASREKEPRRRAELGDARSKLVRAAPSARRTATGLQEAASSWARALFRRPAESELQARGRSLFRQIGQTTMVKVGCLAAGRAVSSRAKQHWPQTNGRANDRLRPRRPGPPPADRPFQGCRTEAI